MKKLSGLLAMLLISTGTNAAQQLSYSGHFVTASGSLTVGDSFTGQFTFNPDAPDLEGFLSDLSGGGAAQSAYYRLFGQNQSASITINGGQPVVGTQGVNSGFVDNSQAFMPPSDSPVTVINAFEGLVVPGVYDTIFVSGFQSPQQPSPSGDGVMHSLGTVFGIIALFAPDTFSLDGVHAPVYQNIFETQPLFLGFNVWGDVYSGSGIIEQTSTANVSAVPLPGAFWLFGSALAGLALRARKPV